MSARIQIGQHGLRALLPHFQNNMKNMKLSFSHAVLSLAVLFTLAPAKAADQLTSALQFSVNLSDVEAPQAWDGQSTFRAGKLPQSAELEIFPVRPGERSELYVNALALKIETLTTGSGKAEQVAQVPVKVRFKQYCNIAVGDECVVQNQGQVIARVVRTR